MIKKIKKGGDIMPRGNGTGPMGMGPMKGREAGLCAGFAVPGYANPFGCGFGFGPRRGFRRRYNATGLPWWAGFIKPYLGAPYFESDVDEKDFLKKQAKFLEDQLEEIKKRLDELEE